ncbi:transposase [Saccharopolyspora sp. 5N102]|uniref:transposase n=1 Tax=Saccharopolyspora sp. 5N102 TaxID=3375155 RepID=UPI0037BCAD59
MHAHLVFVTKYRHPVFTNTYLDRTEEIMRKVRADFETELAEFNGEPTTSTSLPTSRPGSLSRSWFEDLRFAYWKGVRLWSGSDFSEPVGERRFP